MVVTQIQLIALTKTFVPNMCLSHYHSSSLISRCPRTVAAPPEVLNEIFVAFEYQPWLVLEHNVNKAQVSRIMQLQARKGNNNSCQSSLLFSTTCTSVKGLEFD